MIQLPKEDMEKVGGCSVPAPGSKETVVETMQRDSTGHIVGGAEYCCLLLS